MEPHLRPEQVNLQKLNKTKWRRSEERAGAVLISAVLCLRIKVREKCYVRICKAVLPEARCQQAQCGDHDMWYQHQRVACSSAC